MVIYFPFSILFYYLFFCFIPQDYLRQAGEVTYADAHKDKRNEGVVEFATYKDMKSTIDKLDNTEINGR